MEEFQKEVITRLTKIETKLDNFDYKKIESTANEALNKSYNNESDIKDIKDNSRWLWRTTIGAIIATIINLIGLYLKK